LANVHEELYHMTADASLNNGLDLIVAAIGEIRKGPAGIGENFLISGMDESSESRERRANKFEGRLGFAATEIGESPGGVSEHRELG